MCVNRNEDDNDAGGTVANGGSDREFILWYCSDTKKVTAIKVRNLYYATADIQKKKKNFHFETAYKYSIRQFKMLSKMISRNVCDIWHFSPLWICDGGKCVSKRGREIGFGRKNNNQPTTKKKNKIKRENNTNNKTVAFV